MSPFSTPRLSRLLLALPLAIAGCASARFATPGRASALEVRPSLAAGHTSSCLLRPGSTAVCWGLLAPHQLGDGHPDPGLAKPRPLAGAVAVGSGLGGYCTLDDAGRVRCAGVLVHGSQTPADEPVPISLPSPALRLAVGQGHACALLGDRRVACWGANHSGQVGVEASEVVAAPVLVPGLERVVEIASGTAHSCALREDGRVLCWGSNEAGMLGDGTTASRPRPREVEGLADVVRVSTSGLHTCALLADGTIRCWGLGDDGQLGDGVGRPTDGMALRPVAVAGLAGASAVSAGHLHTCALVRGRVLCWGANSVGQVGDGSVLGRTAPVEARVGGDVVEVAAGGGHTCALRPDGSVWCWGNGFAGQTGQGVATQAPWTLTTPIPARVPLPGEPRTEQAP